MCSVGTVEQHVKESYGGESNIFNHYATIYNSNYGSHWDRFNIRKGTHVGSGYNSNIRPVIQYKPYFDDLDNPPIKPFILNNYKTTTHEAFIPFNRPYGNEPLPGNFTVKYNPTNYATGVKPKLGLQYDFIKKRMHNNNDDHKYMPHYTLDVCPFKANPITEYKDKYIKRKHPECDIVKKNLGFKELSGYGLNHKVEEPLLGRPDCAYAPGQPAWLTDRPTGTTLYSDKYVPYGRVNGREPFTDMAGGTIGGPAKSRENGFTKSNRAIPEFIEVDKDKVYDKAENMPQFRLDKMKKEDPVEYQNVIYADKEPTLYNGNYRGLREPEISTAKQLNKSYIGDREDTGHARNNSVYYQTTEVIPPDRFVTHYSTKYCLGSHGVEGPDRYGHLDFQVQDLKPTGFSRTTATHTGPGAGDLLHSVHKLPPYQGRSFLARDGLSTAPPKVLIA